MKAKILGALAALLVLPGLLGNGKLDTIRNTIRCSLINLIATPEKYDGRRVQTIGVATTGFETDFLYLSTEDARGGVMQNGVSLSFKGSKVGEISESDRKKFFNMRRVIVSGVFHDRSGANDGLGAGGISDIDQILPLENVIIEDNAAAPETSPGKEPAK